MWRSLPFSSQLAFRQLRFIGFNLVGTLSGVCVAVLLVFMQIGFMTALVDSVLNLPSVLDSDVFITSEQFETLMYTPPWFPRSLILEARAVPGVADARPFYTNIAQVRNPRDGVPLTARFMAFDPSQPVFAGPRLDHRIDILNLPNTTFLDSRSRRFFIPIVSRLQTGSQERLSLQLPAGTLASQINVRGLFDMGPDFTIDGNFLTSDLNYARLFQFPLDRISIGLVKVRHGYEPASVKAEISQKFEGRAKVYSRDDFLKSQRDYLIFQTPMGIVLGFGVVVGIFIGIVFVVQVLHGIIDANLSEYAVLRAMGYEDRFFISLALQIAAVVGVGAFVPSLVLTALLYQVAAAFTRLEFSLSIGIVTQVLCAVLLMSSMAVLFALRKLRRSDPLDLFA